MVAVNAWGKLSKDDHTVIPLTDRSQAVDQIIQSNPGTPFGMGRSYGDVCLNPNGNLWLTTGLDRFIHLDESSGLLTCEAGVLLRDIQKLVIPRGWILPVTPGTQLITVGGAIANDIHGKNHHIHGAFGDHVRQLTLARTNGETILCGPEQRKEWFSATVGGIGLTGLILSAEIQLRRISGPWLETETIPYANLDDFFQLADDSETDWEHTVSWIDCVSGGGGRGLFMRGNHSAASSGPIPSGRSKKIPVEPPISLVNGLSLRAFNILYYKLGQWQAGASLSHYEPFFYPLDNILEWNRMYGPKGFFQYQCAIPRDVGQNAIQSLLKEISRSGSGSFLAVIKTFGDREPVGMLSFPRPGVTLALDFPNKGPRTEQLFQRLDAIVSEAGGWIYLAKDARMSKKLFEAGYPALERFLSYRDPGISSAMSRRLMDC